MASVTNKRLDILKVQKIIYKLLKGKYEKGCEKILFQYINSALMIVSDIAREKKIIRKYRTILLTQKYVKNDKEMLAYAYESKQNIKTQLQFKLLIHCPSLLVVSYRINNLLKGLIAKERKKYAYPKFN